MVDMARTTRLQAKRKREAASKDWKWLLWESGIARRRAHPTKAQGGGMLRAAEDG